MQAMIPHPIYGRSTAPIKLKPNQTARLELKNTGKESVQVRLQFVDQKGNVIARRDTTILPNDAATLEVSHAGYLGKFSTPVNVDKRFPGDPSLSAQFGAISLLLIRPTLRIIDKKSGDTIRLIGPDGFTKTALRPPVSQP